MKKLDRYIIIKYLKTFFFTALLFSLIAVIIDFSERLDQFIRSQATVEQIVFSYYVHFIAFMNGMLWPLFALISVIFFTSRLAKNSEIISIFNAGVGFNRLMIPYLVASGLIFGVHLVANHYLIPMGSKIRIPFENEYVWRKNNEAKTRHIHILLDPTTKLYIRNYRLRDSTALDLRLEKYHDDALISFTEAKRAIWQGAPNKWKLRDYVSHSFQNEKESLFVHQGEEKDTTIQISPRDLIRIKNQQQVLTSSELKAYINRQKSRGIGGTRVFETELYKRTAEPFSIFILTLIGLAVASRKVRGGIGLHLAIGISLGALYVVFSRFTVTFTNAESLGPLLGIWLPNVVFLVVSVILIRFAQK